MKLFAPFFRCSLAFFVVAVFFQSAQSQYLVSGKVVVDETGKALPGASVYINGSTVGTTANANGEFVLPPVGNGYYEIVASYVGYGLVVYRATIQSADVRVTFRLRARPTELLNIVVLTKEGRAKWLHIFRENFLGITEPAGRSSIKNEDEILFADGTGKHTIKAFSTVPLEIVNKELGFRIFFELEDFYYNASEGRTYFYGYSRFEELQEKGKVPGRYLRNRERYYRGSTLHFYHSLIDNKVKEEGFLLLNIRTVKTTDSVIQHNGVSLTAGQPGNGSVKITGSGKMDMGYPIVPAEFFKRDTTIDKERYLLNFKERLRVNYGKNPYGKAYLTRKVMLTGNLPIGVSSDLEMLESPAYMDPNGSLYNPLAIQVSGYWSFEKLANMLPINYRPSR